MNFPFFGRRKTEPEIEPAWYAHASPEAVARKRQSEAILKSEGVPININLPVIETEEESSLRSVEEIAHRSVALGLVAVKGERELSDEELAAVRKRFDVESHFSPAERAFLDDPTPTQTESVQFLWRYECLNVMLWALGFIETLGRPEKICDVPTSVGYLRDLGVSGMVSKATPRSLKEVLDNTDLIYRYHWAVREARLRGQKAPAGLDPGVTMERHYACNWLVQPDVNWDDVDTST